MKILLVGGGSGGHITPLLGVASEIKKIDSNSEVVAIAERAGVFNHLFDGSSDIDKLYLINAGKFRRYHGGSFFGNIFDLRTFFLNLRDLLRLIIGLVESFWLLLIIRPNIIFIKGGFVGVPVGIIARLLRIPYITHDSDAKPGLTNRLIGKKAIKNAVGMPVSNYRYKQDKIEYVGIPLTDDFNPSEIETERVKRRKELDLTSHDFLLLITGGSNGALRLDKIIHSVADKLIDKNPRLHIVHQTGRDNEDLYKDYPPHMHSRIRVSNFLKPLSSYMAASDLVISRAGATAMAEVGMMKRPMILVPNPYLSGGHQIKNAEVFSENGSAVVVNEHEALENPRVLEREIQKLIDDADLRAKMSETLHKNTKKNASVKIAQLLVGEAEQGRQ